MNTDEGKLGPRTEERTGLFASSCHSHFILSLLTIYGVITTIFKSTVMEDGGTEGWLKWRLQKSKSRAPRKIAD